jgi:Na+-transporting NADH:ubiquinone oxidoreductase subunit C
MKQILRMVFFVLVLGSILTAILITVDHFAAPIIAANERISVRVNVLEALGIETTGEDVDAVFDRTVEISETAGITLFTAADGTKAIAYDGSGLWGPISGILSVDPDGTAIKGVTIIRQEETPGLGGRIAEKEYLALFSGIPLDTPIEVRAAGKSTAPNELDAITGATLSSVAFVNPLNLHIAEAISVLRGDQ